MGNRCTPSAHGKASKGSIGARYRGPSVGPAGQSHVRPEMTMIGIAGTT